MGADEVERVTQPLMQLQLPPLLPLSGDAAPIVIKT
jgi:hypothetical protein